MQLLLPRTVPHPSAACNQLWALGSTLSTSVCQLCRRMLSIAPFHRPEVGVLGNRLLWNPLCHVQDIKRRSLDHFYNLEEDMLGGKVPFATLVQLLQVIPCSAAMLCRLA